MKYFVIGFIIAIILVAIFLSLLAWNTANERDFIQTEATCEDLLEMIKNRNDLPPRYDLTVSKWIALECWK